MLSNIIEGLQIFRKYLGNVHIRGVDHDIIYIADVDNPNLIRMAEEDIRRLDELGFFVSDNEVWARFV